MNTEKITAETLAKMTNEELASVMDKNRISLNPTNGVELIGLVVAERIRRHSLVCQTPSCGFNPVAF